MRRIIVLISAALALGVVVGPVQAAGVGVTIKGNGFAPGNVTLNSGDAITWKNTDKSNHQIVADDGSFASGVLAPGSTYTHAFAVAGTFRYHDAMKPTLKGTVKVKGAAASVAFALSAPIVTYGTKVTLSGQISSHKSGENVSITAQQYGQPSAVALTTVVTGTNGTFTFATMPTQYTTYLAKSGKTTSAPILAQVAPRVTLRPTSNGFMKAQVTAGRSFWHRHLFLQRVSPAGKWVNIGKLTLGPKSGKIFRPASFLSRGTSRIRVFLTVNQAGLGLLSAHSGGQIVRLR